MILPPPDASTRQPPPQPPVASPRRAGLRLAWFIAVLAIVNVLYRGVHLTGLSQSAALYVGVPAALAIALAMSPAAKSAQGSAVKGSVLATLIAGVVLPEGLLCLLFALPIILFVAVVVGAGVDAGRRRNLSRRRSMALVGAPLLVLSLEGVIGSPFDAHDSVVASVVVDATPGEVADALARPPVFDAELPVFLRLGFNRPVAAHGSGLAVGDARRIDFTGGTHDDHPLRLFGGTGRRSVHHHAHLELRIVESTPGRVVFAIEQDTTMLARWVDLERSVVTWRGLADGRTQVTWRLEYERLIFPTLYFAPLQRYGMSEAAGYLLHVVVVAGAS